VQDPDGEVGEPALVDGPEALLRLERNGGW
jgi:hypothetical protein